MEGGGKGSEAVLLGLRLLLEELLQLFLEGAARYFLGESEKMDKAGQQGRGNRGRRQAGTPSGSPLASTWVGCSAGLEVLRSGLGLLQRGTWLSSGSKEFSLPRFRTIAQSFRTWAQPGEKVKAHFGFLFLPPCFAQLRNSGELPPVLFQRRASTCYCMKNKLWSSTAW